MSDETYVTNTAWLRPVGRPEAIDEVADQFERPVTPTPESFWVDDGTRWPLSSRGWRSMARMHPRAAERRVG